MSEIKTLKNIYLISYHQIIKTPKIKRNDGTTEAKDS